MRKRSGPDTVNCGTPDKTGDEVHELFACIIVVGK